MGGGWNVRRLWIRRSRRDACAPSRGRSEPSACDPILLSQKRGDLLLGPLLSTRPLRLLRFLSSLLSLPFRSHLLQRQHRWTVESHPQAKELHGEAMEASTRHARFLSFGSATTAFPRRRHSNRHADPAGYARFTLADSFGSLMPLHAKSETDSEWMDQPRNQTGRTARGPSFREFSCPSRLSPVTLDDFGTTLTKESAWLGH